MAVRIADTLKQQNDLKTFPVALSEDIWIDQNKGEGTADYKDLQALYNEGSLGGSGLPKPESKDKLLLSTENAETSEIEWTQVDKAKVIEIPLYETKAAAEADIANLSDGQIIGTKDEGNENAKPVDVVEKGNLHAVTSNAVAESVVDRVPKIKNNVFGTLSTDYTYAEFDMELLENKICNIMITGNSNKIYLGKFNFARYNDNYNIVLYYGPNLTVSLVGNKIRVACSDGCYSAVIYYVGMYETERMLQ